MLAKEPIFAFWTSHSNTTDNFPLTFNSILEIYAKHSLFGIFSSGTK
jgi:hypothetical protein